MFQKKKKREEKVNICVKFSVPDSEILSGNRRLS